MSVVLTVLNIFIVICALALIILVLVQKGKGSGLGSAFGGAAENFFGKQKSKSRDAKLALYTEIAAGAIAVLAVAMVLISRAL